MTLSQTKQLHTMCVNEPRARILYFKLNKIIIFVTKRLLQFIRNLNYD